jgi:GH15 family glucan-1,4-alpha-glucosidase
MGRPVILGNGSLTVGLNEHGLVHDFYYPYVGLDNLTTSRSVHHKIGVWVDGVFKWVDDEGWEITVGFEEDALVSNVTMNSQELGIRLEFKDFVDSEYNIFCRKVTINNLSGETRNVRLFLHQVFQISRAGRADTALFVPDDDYILDYKGRCSLLIYGRSSDDGSVYDQFAIGNYGIEGKEGTFRDAEDGELSGSPVEHGGVDSVIRFSKQMEPGSSHGIEYWIVAADSQFSAERLHEMVKKEGVEARLQQTRSFWEGWLSTAANGLHAIDKKYLVAVKKSLMLIKAHIDKRGGIVASCDSSIYNYGRDYYSYVWPRDGAYAVWPLIRLGYNDEPRKFFEFCRDILTPEGYLMHKYQPDHAIGSTWHPLLHGNRKELAIQEDETAVVVYMLGEYLDRSQDEDFVQGLYSTLVKPAADFLSSFLDEQTGLPHASYDLWEEKFLTTMYSTAIVYQALLTAGDMAERFEYPDDALRWRQVAAQVLDGAHIFFDPKRNTYRKGFLLEENGSLSFDNVIDVSSIYGAMMFGYRTDNAELRQSVSIIEDILLDSSPSGGLPRYENDSYFASEPPYLGNPWLVTTLWLAQYYARTNQHERAYRYVDWTLERSLPSGALPEQVSPQNGSPISVTPLVWSHAELVNTVLDLAKQK